MAKIKIPIVIDGAKTIEELANRALDDYSYKGRTIREWADLIACGDVRPVVRGKWSWRSSINVPTWCLECGFLKPIDDERKYNFCPNCGADMRKPPKEDKG